jgi:hypothetical protein
LVKGIADFLTGTGEADAYQKELDRRKAATDMQNNIFSQPLSGGGGFIIPTIATAPAYTSGATLGTSYGTPEFKVYVGQKEFDATVKDSVNGMLRDTGR